MNSAKERFAALRPVLLKSLEDDILKFWTERSVDNINGGFFGHIDHLNRPLPGAGKGVILNTRILWSFSAAAAFLDSVEYRKLADRAYAYLTEYFTDKKHGGVFWELDALGNPLNTRKQIYAQAFAIYSLSEYYILTGDNKALEQAKELFSLTEKHSRDRKDGGYTEAFREDWSEIEDFRLSDKDLNAPKTMNTNTSSIRIGSGEN